MGLVRQGTTQQKALVACSCLRAPWLSTSQQILEKTIDASILTGYIMYDIHLKNSFEQIEKLTTKSPCKQS